MLPPDAVGYFNTLMAGKFLATQSKAGKVNVVFVATMKAYDDRTLVFGNMMLRKSHGNLEDDDKVSACVVTENLKSYEVKGKFKGFERSGKYFDEVSNIPVIRYIAYGALRSVGIIEVEDISIPLKRPVLGLVSGIATTRLLSKKSLPAGKMPPNVMEKFERLKAIKVIAAREDGYPRIIPVLCMRAVDPNTLIFSCASSPNLLYLKDGQYVTSSVLTMDAISYQVKGIFEGFKKSGLGKIGRISVEEVYSSSPPRPGERIA